MQVNVSSYIKSKFIGNDSLGNVNSMQLPDITLNTENIRVIMISEIVPQDPKDFFYSTAECSDYMKSTMALFNKAGGNISSIHDIISAGIYITTAVKLPKSGYAVDSNVIKSHALILEEELNLFPNTLVIMLMGDVAKKAFNLIAKKNTKKNVIPPESTYKIRRNEYFYGNIRVFPSYIMTGGNILIEKSKFEMITDDIRRMLEIIQQ